LDGAKAADLETELQYVLSDAWAVRILVALFRKHGVKPYRCPRQRRTTVMVRIRKSDFEQTIAVKFRSHHREFAGYFDEMVNHLIADVMKSYGNDETLEQSQISR